MCPADRFLLSSTVGSTEGYRPITVVVISAWLTVLVEPGAEVEVTMETVLEVVEAETRNVSVRVT